MDTQQYQRVMETIKGRKEHIDWTIDGAESMGKISIFMVESIGLQLRKTLEDIAVACVIANSDETPGLTRALRGEYRPGRILKELGELNPECYPIPLVENVAGSHGHFRDTQDRPEGDWLAMAEIVKEYGRLNNLLHQTLKSYIGAPVDVSGLYQRCLSLDRKICNLLSHHQITVLDKNTMYRVIMAGQEFDGDGKLLASNMVQMAEFERIQGGTEQLDTDAIAGLDDAV